MYKTTLVQDVIWYTNPLILLACAFCLRRSQERDRFRGFFCYLIFCAVASVVSMLVFYRWGYGSTQYFYSWWAMNLVSVVLAFVALYEVVGDVLTAGTPKLSRRSIIAGVVLSVIVSTILALALDDNERDPLMKLIFVGDNVLRFNEIGILLGLVVMSVFSDFTGEGWRLGSLRDMA